MIQTGLWPPVPACGWKWKPADSSELIFTMLPREQVLDFPREPEANAAELVAVGVKPAMLPEDAVDPATGKPWGG